MIMEPYIFTEIINCGKIGRIALDSFHKYHHLPVHVFGTRQDFVQLLPNDNNILIEVAPELVEKFKAGHAGTAALWTQVIRQATERLIIHFDSDVIFRAEAISDLIRLSANYDLIGPIRNYRHNPQHNPAMASLPDVCQTSFFLFNKERISWQYRSKSAFNWYWRPLINFFKNSREQTRQRVRYFLTAADPLEMMVKGGYNPLGHATIDFFDPVMFDMINNGAKVFHLDFDDFGGCNFYGRRDNAYRELNDFPTPFKIDFGKKMVHFSAVGSGMNFYYAGGAISNVSQSYIDYAIDRYALFCKIFYQEDIAGVDLSKYQKILEVKDWY